MRSVELPFHTEMKEFVFNLSCVVWSVYSSAVQHYIKLTLPLFVPIAKSKDGRHLSEQLRLTLLQGQPADFNIQREEPHQDMAPAVGISRSSRARTGPASTNSREGFS